MPRLFGMACLALAPLAFGQPAGPQRKDPIEALRAEIQELRDQLAGSRRESQELRREVQELRERMDQLSSAPAATLPDQVAEIADEQQTINAKLDEQYQTKVASGSKYRLRLSGMVLLN